MDGLLEEEWTLGSSFWYGSNIARADGAGILMTNPYIRPKASRIVESGRILVLDLEIQGSPLRVINVYGPTNVPESLPMPEAQVSPPRLDASPGGGGDFNCALRDEDRSKPRRDRSSKELQAIIDDFSLTDVGGSTPPTPTWVSSSGASYSRIYMFLLSPGLRMRSLTSEAAHFSDHRMVTVTLDWEGLVNIGSGSWRMNTSVLEDQTIRLSFSRRYLEWRTLKELYDSPIEC
ncbi:hypothetical protein DPEC_G00259730 [Dallia pectoralis]|uniref:Uncharacterized protein n=1 Tax=Dallia pectoralis TaxID=75939 RepID=A0ACC2FR67_DALPE|nr:hypothetical protein DPEC_G00259730 [Dallia pectoralis]